MQTIFRNYTSLITDLSSAIKSGESIPTLKGDMRALQSPLSQLDDLKKWINEQQVPLTTDQLCLVRADLLNQLYQLYLSSKAKSFPFTIEIWEIFMIQDEIHANGNKSINTARELHRVAWSKDGTCRYVLRDVMVV